VLYYCFSTSSQKLEETIQKAQFLKSKTECPIIISVNDSKELKAFDKNGIMFFYDTFKPESIVAVFTSLHAIPIHPENWMVNIPSNVILGENFCNKIEGLSRNDSFNLIDLVDGLHDIGVYSLPFIYMYRQLIYSWKDMSNEIYHQTEEGRLNRSTSKKTIIDNSNMVIKQEDNKFLEYFPNIDLTVII